MTCIVPIVQIVGGGSSQLLRPVNAWLSRERHSNVVIPVAMFPLSTTKH